MSRIHTQPARRIMAIQAMAQDRAECRANSLAEYYESEAAACRESDAPDLWALADDYEQLAEFIRRGEA